jgi:hypothetical protein
MYQGLDGQAIRRRHDSVKYFIARSAVVVARGVEWQVGQRSCRDPPDMRPLTLDVSCSLL